MKWIATECAWFSAFFEKPLLNLANLFIDMRMVRFCRSTEGTGFEIPVPCHPQWSRGSPRSAIRAEETGCIGVRSDSLQEGTCVDALRGSRAFLAWDCHVGCRFVSGLFARPMAAGLDGLSASRGSHLDFALDAHSLAAGLPR